MSNIEEPGLEAAIGYAAAFCDMLAQSTLGCRCGRIGGTEDLSWKH
ncbi:MAG: hypothetical protein HOH37_04535 [Gammaproteobacteria bacterium]|nr:hypothetical protein [Gammaproteobacteria bacterium]